MSNATLKVRFKKDNLILYGQYFGTSDICHPNLFPTLEEAWSHHRHTDEGWAALTGDKPSPVEEEVVEIYSNYGGGWYWTGLACRHTRRITANSFGFEDEYDTRDRSRIFTDNWAEEEGGES